MDNSVPEIFQSSHTLLHCENQNIKLNFKKQKLFSQNMCTLLSELHRLPVHCSLVYKVLITKPQSHLIFSKSTQLLDHLHFSINTDTNPFNGPFPGLPRWASTRKVKPNWILLKQETVSGSGISWASCKSAPCSRQITMPAPQHWKQMHHIKTSFCTAFEYQHSTSVSAAI